MLCLLSQKSAHVRGGTSNSPNTRAQADTAQIGMTNRRRSVANKLGAGCAVTQLNTSQRSEPGKMQTSNCVGKLHASILSASRFANRRFWRPWIGFLQASDLRTSRNPLLTDPPYLNPFHMSRSHSSLPSSLRGACWPLPSRGIRRIQNLGCVTVSTPQLVASR